MSGNRGNGKNLVENIDNTDFLRCTAHSHCRCCILLGKMYTALGIRRRITVEERRSRLSILQPNKPYKFRESSGISYIMSFFPSLSFFSFALSPVFVLEFLVSFPRKDCRFLDASLLVEQGQLPKAVKQDLLYSLGRRTSRYMR